MFDDRYVIPPEVLWYVLQIADEGLFTQILGMTKTQLWYWSKLLESFDENEKVSVKDLAQKTHRSSRTINRYVFNFFEEKGLIITTREGRERFAELVPGVGDSSFSKTLVLPYAKVENEYTSWLEHQSQKNLPTKTKEIKLIDFQKGLVYEKSVLQDYQFQSKINLVIKERKNKTSYSKKLESSERPKRKQTEEWKDVFKRKDN